MPELPEVQTLCSALRLHLPHRKILSVQVRQPKLRWPVPENLAQRLIGRDIRTVARRGKYLLLHSQQGTLIVHLGMSGTLHLSSGGEAAAGRHDHVLWQLDGGLQLAYRDPRRFGSLHWTGEDPLEHRLLKRLGPEPLGNGFTADYLLRRCEGRRTAIKSLLMDAGAVAGIGNIYACEALFEAGLRPHRSCGSLGSAELEPLTRSVRDVLRRAIEAGGTTIRDFQDMHGTPGYFAQQLQVYGRQGQACRRCGAEIRNQPLSGRATCFCPVCQQ